MWFPKLGLLSLLCCCSLEPVEAGKVLVVPTDGSHWLSMKILVKELVRKGHEVLVLIPETSLLIAESESFKTEIYKMPITKAELDRTLENFKDRIFNMSPVFTQIINNLDLFVNYTNVQVRACKDLLSNESIISKLTQVHFDVVLTDPFIPCGAILAQKFSIPAIYFLHDLPGSLDMAANQIPTPPSFVPVALSGNTNVMNFPQRVKNILMYGLESYLNTLLYYEFDKLVIEELKEISSYKELLGRGAFWLLRSDFAFDWPKPIMPNMALIGGINCAKKVTLPAVSIESSYSATENVDALPDVIITLIKK